MDETSTTLINAQINFIDDKLRLIHIPRACYSAHVQTILQLLLDDDDEANDDDEAPRKLWTMKHPFFNISFNSVECSILCSSNLAQKYFGHCPVSTNNSGSSTAIPSVSKEDFVVISVEGEGLEAGQRVLDITTPLAMASIPIFFITTYFCDYILVPLASRGQVVSALEDRGFVFESPTPSNSAQDSNIAIAAHHRNRSSFTSSTAPPGSGSQSGTNSSPSTPPPASVSELQTRTFKMLAQRNINLSLLSSIRLTQCAGRHDPAHSQSQSVASITDLQLQLALIKTLARPPAFFSTTLTSTDPPAFLMEDTTKTRIFNSGPPGSDDGEIVIGGSGSASRLVAIMLNLEMLPLEATGIVCGVAGRLAEATREGVGGIEMSYLSTARTGTVLVGEEDLGAAMRALGLKDPDEDEENGGAA